MSKTVQWTVDDGIGRLTLSRSNGNAINPELIVDLLETVREAAADKDVRAVVLTGAGKLFSPGLDLAELRTLDRPELAGFLQRFNACLLNLYTFPRPLIAAIRGHAVAGGCVLALTADWRIISDQALAGLNEVKVGVPFPFGVSMMLCRAVSPRNLDEIALLGRNYRGAEAVTVGLAHESHAIDAFDDVCAERVAEFADKDPSAFAVTKRYLRSATVERIRAHDAAFIGEFLDGWFSKSTQARIDGVLKELAARKK